MSNVVYGATVTYTLHLSFIAPFIDFFRVFIRVICIYAFSCHLLVGSAPTALTSLSSFVWCVLLSSLVSCAKVFGWVNVLERKEMVLDRDRLQLKEWGKKRRASSCPGKWSLKNGK